MDIDTSLATRVRLPARLLGPAIAALLTLAPAGSVLGQGTAGEFPFPATLAGEELQVETFTGPEYVAQFEEGEGEDRTFVEGTMGLVEGVGATLDDLTVKSALYQPTDGVHAVIAGFRIEGVEARTYVEDAVRLLLGDVVEPGLLVRPVAGKWVLRVVDESMPGVYPRTVFVNGDIAWIIEGDDEFVWDALDQLPALEPNAASAVDTLLAGVPVVLDGQRRTELWELTEPFILPTLSARLGQPFEAWLRDLYLDGGLTPLDMIGFVASWGIESSQDGIQIEGYQVPGADPELVERLRSEVLLADDTELPEGVTRREEEVGGRTVSTIDYGEARQHIFSSGDTVWVVTDQVGSPEVAAEAVAALP